MYVDKYEPSRKHINFIKKFSKSLNAASGSEVDANSNVSNKNIATMAPEVHKKDNIYTNRLWMHDRIKELYGEQLAEEYLRQLESHEIYRHDESGMPIGTPYCASITLYPFLYDGMKKLGGTTGAPKHLKSFIGGFINLVFAVSAQLCGAVATPEFLPYMDYFIRKAYGNDYYLNTDRIVDLSEGGSTIDKVITQYFDQVVYSLNQPAAARGSQSVFWNLAYFDKPYFEQLFDGFVFPDGEEMKWESFNWLQRRFMKWFNNERLKNILTFPVETLSLLNDGTGFVDQDMADFAAEMYAEGHSFFTYTSDSVDSLASCCYDGSTKVMIKDACGAYLVPFHKIENMNFDQNGYRVFNNGKWSKGKLVKLPNRPMYRVETANGKEMTVTDNHRNNCFGGMKLTKDLTTDDYIMLNSTALDTFPEKDEHLTYEQGFAIGAFLGDGSFGATVTNLDGGKTIYETNYSLSEKKKWIIPIIEKAVGDCGIEANVRVGHDCNNVLPVRISSKEFVAFLIRWTNWERGVLCFNKELNMDCLLQSIDFRMGIMDGWFATDGNMNSLKNGASLRGYSTSKNLIECMDVVATSCGFITSVSIDERTDSPVFRGVTYEKNYPVYCLLRFAKNKQSKMSRKNWIFSDNSFYVRVKRIEKVEHNGSVFCFEMDDPHDDKFTLANGIHNFNCRLRNGIQDNTFSYTLGAGGVSTGSKCVMTINVNRLVQNAARDKIPISVAVETQVRKIHKYLIAFNSIILDMKDKRMLPLYDAGFISPEKQYLTIGINGLVEGAEYLRIKVSDNDEYRRYVNTIMEPIFRLNREERTEDIMFNTEMVPSL